MRYGASVTLPCFNFSFAFPWYQWEQMCYQLHWAQTDSGCIWQEFGENLVWSTTWKNLFCFNSNKLPQHEFPEPFGCEKPLQMSDFQSACLSLEDILSNESMCNALYLQERSIYKRSISEDISRSSVFGHFYCVCRAVTRMFCFGSAEEAVQSPPKLLNFII